MRRRPTAEPLSRDDTVILLRRLWRDWLSPHWKGAAAVLVIVCIIAGTTGLYPLVINWTYDAFTAHNAAAIWLAPIMVIAVTCIKGIAMFAQVALTNRLMSRITTDMQVALFNHLVDADLARLQRESAAALTQRFTTDLGFVRDALTRVVTNMIRDSFTVIALVVAMFWLDWVLSLLAFAILPLAIVPINRIGRRLRKVATTTQEQVGLMAALVSESLGGARMVKTFGLEGYLKDRARDVFERVRRLRIKSADSKGRLDPMLELIGGITVALVLVVIGWRILDGTSTIGEFTGFVSALLLASQPMRALGNLNAVIQEGLSAAKRVFAVLDEKPAIVDSPGARPLAITEAALRLEHVSFRYPDGTLALDDVSIDVPGGRTTALVGRSGAGKSTVFSLVPRLFDVDAGAVTIDGSDVRAVTLESLRRAIAVVSQDVILFSDTIANNIALGRIDASREEIEAAAKAAAAHDFIMAMPNGYDTQVGDRGVRLSGGERQRISIARAILKDAPILLLDEATSALDTESERAIQDALRRLARGRTTLVIAHRLSTVRDADQIVVLEHGRVAESGTHEALIARGGIYARLYRLQFREDEAAGMAAVR